MKLSDYIRSCGLFSSHVAKKMGVTKQMIDAYGKSSDPTLKTMVKIATAMSELGVPTTVADITKALLSGRENNFVSGGTDK